MTTAIVNKAASMIPSNQALTHEYLERLMVDAQNETLPGGWFDELNGVMKGLYMSGVINATAIDEFDTFSAEARQCKEEEFPLVKNACSY